MGAAASLTCRSGQGFTVVELVAVILLLAILSITALGRFVRPSAFAPAVLSAGLVAEVRQARQLAAARSDARVTLELSADGGDWHFALATDVDGVVEEERIAMANTSLVASSGAVSAALGAGAGLRLTFHGDGDLAAIAIAGSPGDADLGVEVALSGDSTRTLCIYPSGYATDSACL